MDFFFRENSFSLTEFSIFYNSALYVLGSTCIYDDNRFADDAEEGDNISYVFQIFQKNSSIVNFVRYCFFLDGTLFQCS